MVSDERVLAGEGESQGELAGEREVAPVVGIPVLSADGRALGQVLDVIIETGGDPHAVGYEITERTRGGTAFVPLAAQVALSGDNLLLSSDAEQWMGDDLASVRMASDAFPPPDPGDRR
jgi:hypothetical protein